MLIQYFELHFCFALYIFEFPNTSLRNQEFLDIAIPAICLSLTLTLSHSLALSLTLFAMRIELNLLRIFVIDRARAEIVFPVCFASFESGTLFVDARRILTRLMATLQMRWYW